MHKEGYLIMPTVQTESKTYTVSVVEVLLLYNGLLFREDALKGLRR
jgi:hypothetical protein